MDANVGKFLKLAFRKGDPAGEGKRAMTAMARKGHGLFGGAQFPDVPRDSDVISEEDLSIYVSALERNGFFGPSSWYMNHATNAAYGRKAVNDGYLDVPVLFIAALYDYVCESVHSRLGEPMRKYSRNLKEEVIKRWSLGGSGEATRSQRGAREMARHQRSERLAASGVN